MKIFLAEDHNDTRELLCFYFEQLGHTVDYARSMHEALIKLAAADYDLLISDIGLPDGNGWELLRRSRRSSSTYAVAISGFGTNADEARSLSAGYRHHLIKPLHPEKIDAILAEAAGEISRRGPSEIPSGSLSDSSTG